MKNIYSFSPALPLALVLIATSACTPMLETHGNFLQTHTIQSVQVNTDTRVDVVKKLGSPTTIAPFDDKVWYYLGQKMIKKGIFDSKVDEERIVMVQFNEEGTVAAINNVKSDRLDIPLNDGKTQTGGNEVTVLQQLLGNLGKFNGSSQ